MSLSAEILDGLKVWFSFEDTNWTASNDPAITLTPVSSPLSQTGKVGNALTCDGNDALRHDYATWNALSSAAGHFAVWGWAKVALGASATLLGRWGATTGTQQWVVTVQNTGTLTFFHRGTSGTALYQDNSVALIPDNVLFFFAVRFQRSSTQDTVKITINETTVSLGPFTRAAPNADTTTPFEIAVRGNASPTAFLVGQLDETAIWESTGSKAVGLSDEALAYLYNGGDGRSFASVSSFTRGANRGRGMARNRASNPQDYL